MRYKHKSEIISNLREILSAKGISLSRVARDLEGASGSSANQAQIGKRIIENLDWDDLVGIHEEYGIELIPLISTTENNINVTGNAMNIGTGHISGDKNKIDVQGGVQKTTGLSPKEFLNLDEKERNDYLRFLELTK